MMLQIVKFFSQLAEIFIDLKNINLAETKYESMVNLVEQINKGPYSWKATIDKRFVGLTLAEIKAKAANSVK